MIKCTFENGGKAALRHTVVDNLVIKNNQILLIKRAPHLLNGNKWGFPGGYVDRDETVAQAALRELKEETGYGGEVTRLFKVLDNPQRKGEDRQNIAFVYLIKPHSQTSKPDKNEVADLKWYSFDNLPKKEDFAFDHFEIIQDFLKVEMKDELFK